MNLKKELFIEVKKINLKIFRIIGHKYFSLHGTLHNRKKNNDHVIFFSNLYFCLNRNPAVNDLNSFINTSRLERAQSMMSSSARADNYYPSQSTNFETQSEINFNAPQPLRSFSPDDLQKLKYKIDLG